MFLLYTDEFGHSGFYDPADPRHAHSPIFGLGGILVEHTRVRHLDRAYLEMKRRYFRSDIAQSGKRDERYEFKGNRLAKPSNATNRRNLRFGRELLELLISQDCKILARGRVKEIAFHGHDGSALYGTTVQALMNCLERVLRHIAGKHRGQGLILIDRRTEEQNKELMVSAQSYLYSRFPPFERIVESPLVLDSEFLHLAQATDNVCGILGGVLRWRYDPANGAGYAHADARFGDLIDALTIQIGTFSSVTLGQRTGGPAAPPPAGPPPAGPGGPAAPPPAGPPPAGPPPAGPPPPA